MDKYAADIVGIETEKLAKKYNIADTRRLSAILQKAVTDAYGRRFYNNDSISINDGLDFNPSLHEALTILPPETAFRLFEASDLNALASKIFYYEYLVDGEAPFYTHEELADLLGLFASYLKANKPSLLAIGYPEKSFEQSHWLYEKLSRLYPVKIPFKTLKGTRFHQRFNGDHNFAEKDAEGNLVFEYAWIKEPLPFLSPYNSEQPTSCSYADACLIKGLTDRDVEHIEDCRARMFNLKIDILEIASGYLLKKKDTAAFWDNCMEKISQRLTKDTVEKLLKIEEAYSRLFVSNMSSKFMITCPSAVTAGQPNLETGGIDNILSFIFFVETELSIGQMHNVRRKLLALTGGKIPESYYELIPSPSMPDIDQAIEESLRNSVKTAEFEDVFDSRLKTDSEKKLKVRLEVSSANYDTVRRFSELVESGQVNFFFGAPPIIPAVTGKKVVPIELPSGASWEDITIEFKDNHNVTIKCKGKTIRSDYKDMGFEDSKSRRPNKQWELLLNFAANKGEIAWDKSPSGSKFDLDKTEQDFGYEMDDDTPESTQNKGFSVIKAPDKTKKTKQLLSQSLKAVFSIDGDPFYPYEEVKAYKIRIKLIP